MDNNSDEEKNSDLTHFNRKSIDNDDPFGMMLIALDDEIKSLSKGTKKVTLRNAKYIQAIGDFYIYGSLYDDVWPFGDQVDEIVFTINDSNKVNGYIQSFIKNEILVALEENAGKTIDKLILSSGDSALLEFLRDKLFSIYKNEYDGYFNTNLADLIIRKKEPKISNGKLPDKLFKYLARKDINLFKEQEDSITRSLNSNLTLLWGPPGTGKTFTLGILISYLVVNEEKILIASNTNKAVDGALTSIINHLKNWEIEDPGTCLRVGAGVTKEFQQNYGDIAIPNQILENRFKDLKDEKEMLFREKEPLDSKFKDLRWKIAEYNSYEECKASIIETQNKLEEYNKNYPIKNNLFIKIESEINDLEMLLINAPERSNLLTVFGLKKTREEIIKDLDKLKYKFSQLKEVIDVLANDTISCEIKYKELNVSLANIQKIISVFPPLNDLKKEFEIVSESIEIIEDRLSEIDDIINNGMKELFDNCKVIGTTVYKTYLDKDVSNIKFDTVVIDEASMSLLPLTFFAAGKASKRVVIVGDFNQLPAIVIASDKENVIEWIKKDPFEKFEVRKGLKNKNLPIPVVGLRVQDRMIKDINDLISKHFYNNRLECSKRIIDSRSSLKLSFSTTGNRILYIDTGPLGAWSSKRAGKGSCFNITSAAIVASLIDKINSSSIFNSNSQNAVGVVTPYAAQRDLLIQLLIDYYDLIKEDSIGTAHRFQGSEKEIIIFDIVSANEKPSKFVNATEITDDATKLLNVALSRAKSYLIFIGDIKNLIDKGGTILKRVVKYIQLKGEEVNGIKILEDTEFLDRSNSLSEGCSIPINVPQALFTENLFYPVLKNDLNESKVSVVIYSAFITKDGLTRWFPYFYKMLNKGIKIKIVTKNLPLQPNARKNNDVLEILNKLISLLRSAGVIVNVNREIHEKVIIIDNRIVWHGSLNMLSHNPDGSSEFMVRTDSEEHALGFIEMLTRHDFKKKNITESDHPRCPCCSGFTEIKKGFKGLDYLYCESCDWLTKSTDFWKLSSGIPIGRAFSNCPESGCDGKLKLRTWGNKYILGCSSYKSNNCKYKENIVLKKLNFQYDPFPNIHEISPNILNNYFQDNEIKPIPKKDKGNILVPKENQINFPFDKKFLEPQKPKSKPQNNNELKPIKKKNVPKRAKLKKMSLDQIENELANFQLKL